MAIDNDDVEQVASYFHKEIGSNPTPVFESPEQLNQYWGRCWGATDEIGTLQTVLMRRPNRGLGRIDPQYWDPRAGAIVDPDRRWYWKSPTPPDIELVDQQHSNLVSTLEGQGVKVILAADLSDNYLSSVYVRDPMVAVPGGAIIGRLGPRMRRGEEASITQAVAAAGMPILGTITGSGIVEGGSFLKINRELAVYAESIRCNVSGADQLERILGDIGMKLRRIQLPGYIIHIDGQIAMLDYDTALVNAHRLPYEFLRDLESWGIELVHTYEQEESAINSLVLGPGRILMPAHSPRTAEKLSRRGMEVVTVEYDEIVKGGGGIHCSTHELQRTWQ